MVANVVENLVVTLPTLGEILFYVINYMKENFTQSGQRYDLIFDNVSNHSFSERRRILNSNGICVLAGIGGAGSHEGQWARLGGSLKALVGSWFVSQKFVTFIARITKEDLTILRELIATGKVTPVIDKCYRLSEVPEAIRYLEERHSRQFSVLLMARVCSSS